LWLGLIGLLISNWSQGWAGIHFRSPTVSAKWIDRFCTVIIGCPGVMTILSHDDEPHDEPQDEYPMGQPDEEEEDDNLFMPFDSLVAHYCFTVLLFWLFYRSQSSN
jgi:hypothetical protein